MTYFKVFQNDIKNIGGVWGGNDIYFSQMKDGYSATYKPKYPDSCIEDMVIQTLENSGAYKRGNYELIIWKENKYGCEYFNNIEEIKQYFSSKNGGI